MEVVLENTGADNPLQPAVSEHIYGSYTADISCKDVWTVCKIMNIVE
jgi:hypothetical protein